MEKLSLKDHSFDERRSERWVSRLPTPDPSRGSFDHSEGSNASASTETALRRDSHARPDFDRTSSYADGYYKPMPDARCRDEPAPYSPPYDASDAEKPSLPPLKSLLGDNMASPPRTPKTLPTPLQLVTREPSYFTDTYKPPSLYPNKKQRTDTLERPTTLDTTRYFSAQPTMTRPETSANPSPVRGPFNPSATAGHGRESFYDARHPPSRMYAEHALQDPIAHYDAVGPRGLPHEHERVAHVTHPGTLKRGWSGPVGPADYHARTTPPHYRTYSVQGEDLRYSQYPQPQYVQMPSPRGEYMYASPAQDDYRRVENGVSFGRAEADYGPGAYAHEQHMVDGFVPGRYEYYYPKARKRSNLPKHSTEIMRTWFDQNISNPYPSEDQKALFANATGISLTQVSNWFINHRRRCPELRDKRAERRKI